MLGNLLTSVTITMFYIIGLGLGDAKDISVKGLEVVKRAERVYLESYTSMLTVGKEALEHFYGRDLIIADRDLIEQCSNDILKDAGASDIALLVVGDPFGATTHIDVVLRAQELGIPFQVIHNASIMNAIGCCGLQLYSFGETISIPYWTDTWQPDSFYDKIAGNRKRGLHTLCLLDIRVKEPTIESLTKKTKEYQPPRFMSVSEAAAQLLHIIDKKGTSEPPDLAYTSDTWCVGAARVGSETQCVLACSLREMRHVDLGPPLHCLVICGQLQPLEVEYLTQFAKDKKRLLEMK